MISCKSFVENISKRDEKKLSGKQKIQLSVHFLACSLCRRYYAQDKMIMKVAKLEFPADSTLSEGDKEQMITTIVKA